MQKYKITLLSFFFIHVAHAQIPILTSALNPVIGDNYAAYLVDTTAVDLSLTGSSQLWNISSASIDSVPFTNYIGKDVANTPYASTFSTTASIGVQDVEENFYSYFITSSGKLELNGYGDFLGTTFFSNPATILTFPFTYNDVINDNIVGISEVGVVTFTVSGTSNTTADAYGTLTLPSGSYNVLRGKVNQSIVSTNVAGTITTHLTTYYWYSELYKFPLMEVDITEVSGTGIFAGTVDQYIKKAFIIPPQLVGIKENKLPSFSFYPNPGNDFIVLSFQTRKMSTITVSIIDLTERIVKEDRLEKTAGLYTEQIDVKQLSKGSYFLRLNIDGIVSQQKIIIQ